MIKLLVIALLISDNLQQAHVVSHWGAENGFTTTGGEP